MSAHAPWTVKSDTALCEVRVIDAANQDVCQIEASRWTGEMTILAGLISAAPEMLAALKLISGMDIYHEALAVVDAAIAKAEGRA